ncbi:hypothetical protein BDZ89DRAFT_1132420 [Hymenopellis radicata]|nr:hypothetical protein BDZ89DRAFT_1132420 [Hymenopellis radicata]
MANLSLLDLVALCDNARPSKDSSPPSPFDEEKLVPFCLSQTAGSPVLGLLRPIIVSKLALESIYVWDIQETRVSFHADIDSPAKRSAIMRELCERWRDEELFPDVCGPRKWRSELYAVWKDPFGGYEYPSSKDDDNSNFAFEMERSACALFGVITYGVHMSAFEHDDNGLRIWIPTRARTKQTWPGFLDNSVAGGIPSGMTPFESLVKECMEEASIEEDIARKHVRSSGAVSYFFRTSQGWLQPEIEYVYELLIPPNHPTPEAFVPKPSDGEVESFELMDLELVLTKLRQGLFKPNCAVVIIELLIRLGYVTRKTNQIS